MTDIFREVDEALREDRAKQIWQRYGTAIIAAAVLLVAATAAYVGWQSYRASRDQAASLAIANALALAATDQAAAADAFAAAATEGGSGHAALARMFEADARLESGDRGVAVALYRGIAADSDVDPPLRDLARLLAVLNDLDEGDPAALEAELAPLTRDTSPWRFSAREIEGLIAIRQGDTAHAKTLFDALANDPEAPPGVSRRAGELSGVLGN